MDASTFSQELDVALLVLDRSIEITVFDDEVTVDRVIAFSQDLFLNIFYNPKKNKIAFALVGQQKRIWGIDRDNIRGWHRHPLHQTETHESISPKTISEIIAELKQVLTQIEK